MPTSVFLVRHGEYLQPAASPGEACSDGGLTERGRLQALALRDRIARTAEVQAQALYCSTLRRARETAELMAPALGAVPVALPALCEWDSGNEALGAEGFVQRWQALAPAERHAHRFHPGCETAEEFDLRVRSALQVLLEQHENRTFMIVAHGGVVELAFAHFLGLGRRPFEGGYPAVGHTSLTHWRQPSRHADWILEFANDTSHLRSPA